MPELTPSKELTSGLASVFERIGEFFHIFDLSFFVAGASTLAALVFSYVNFVYFRLPKDKTFTLEGWMWVVATIVASYICGLISFAGGRFISETLFGFLLRKNVLKKTLLQAISDHKLNKHPKLQSYVPGTDDNGCGTSLEKSTLNRLYIRMWSEVAHSNDAPLFWHHLTRYWAMTATYDAVAFSLIVWAVSLLAVGFSLERDVYGYGPCVAGAAISFMAVLISFYRGTKYYTYQVEDLVAHFASTWEPKLNT